MIVLEQEKRWKPAYLGRKAFRFIDGKKQAKNHDLLDVQGSSRRGGKFLHLDLQRIKDREHDSLRRRNARNKGSSNGARHFNLSAKNSWRMTKSSLASTHTCPTASTTIHGTILQLKISHTSITLQWWTARREPGFPCWTQYPTSTSDLWTTMLSEISAHAEYVLRTGSAVFGAGIVTTFLRRSRSRDRYASRGHLASADQASPRCPGRESTAS